MTRTLDENGKNLKEALLVLGQIIPDTNPLVKKSIEIIQASVNPSSRKKNQGLVYGLIQSGKTNVIIASAALALDNGFKCLIILTSDIDPLYEQTLSRLSKPLRLVNILGKNDWEDKERFKKLIKTIPVVLVCSKNSSKLRKLVNVLKEVDIAKFPTLIIDDEADQASLNTYTSTRNRRASRGQNTISAINTSISNLRDYFSTNTYLQVTATPQALFLQTPKHNFRPAFTVLIEPGTGYIGGDSFFQESSKLLQYVDQNEIDGLCPATSGSRVHQEIPEGLKEALFTFLVGASSRVITNSNKSELPAYSFLCHVSLKRLDHAFIVNLIDNFKLSLVNSLSNPNSSDYKQNIEGLKKAYKNLNLTDSKLPSFEKILEKIKLYISAASIKSIHGDSNHEISLDSVFNIFVGGTKLGRGVTLKNLLVSYYGRNPKKPNSDTVLQHARMYGYRSKDIGVTRLFLPQRLAEHFISIHQMETALRTLIAEREGEGFEGIYLSQNLNPTRVNVIDPASIGIYLAGKSYNLPYPLRDLSISNNTSYIDKKLEAYTGNQPDRKEEDINFIIDLIKKCKPDPNHPVKLWDIKALEAALLKLKSLNWSTGYIVVRRNRKLNKDRKETQGILSGSGITSEYNLAPLDKPTLFMYRVKESPNGKTVAWWPQLRFPDGNYAMTFSFNW